jgi:hypothetical protein
MFGAGEIISGPNKSKINPFNQHGGDCQYCHSKPRAGSQSDAGTDQINERRH